MQMYDVQQRELYLIKSQTGISYNIALVPGESVVGLGGVQVFRAGRRVIITSGRPTVQSWGYHIDYDADGTVIYPVTPSEIEKMIRDLTAIGCCEYTADLLRAINDRRQVQAGMQALLGEGDKIHKIRL